MDNFKDNLYRKTLTGFLILGTYHMSSDSGPPFRCNIDPFNQLPTLKLYTSQKAKFGSLGREFNGELWGLDFTILEVKLVRR